MHIVAQLGGSEEEQQKDCIRPGACPLCGGVDDLVGHGYYLRKPKGLIADQGIGSVSRKGTGMISRKGSGTVWIKRWFCKRCHRTISVLPDFLLTFRQYVVPVIQAVIEARWGCGKTWAALEAECAEAGAPARRTMQRWCGSFAEQASRWLRAVQATLAQQDSASPWLDPQGEALQVEGPAQALLGASEHLLAWGKTRWAEAAGYGRNDRLRFLWLWSSGRSLGRLV